MKRILIFLFPLAFNACKYKQYVAVVDSRNSFLDQYIALHDTIDFSDTNEINFRILKAYRNNDSTFFSWLQRDIEITKKQRDFERSFDSCVHLKDINQPGVDAAFRFQHSQSFCPLSQVITISLSNKAIKMHYLEFSGGSGDGTTQTMIKNGDTIFIPAYCQIQKDFEKTLTIKDWKTLLDKLTEVDFWGLKKDNGLRGLDGSFWEINGYIKETFKSYFTEKTHNVYRWSPANRSFVDLGRYFIKLSGEEQLCGDIY